MQISTELFKGYVEILLLQSLSRDDMYGYALRKHIHEVSQFRCQLSEGTLYPALHKLARKGYVSQYTKREESTRPRKYYTLTPSGELYLRQLLSQWQFLNSLVVTFSTE